MSEKRPRIFEVLYYNRGAEYFRVKSISGVPVWEVMTTGCIIMPELSVPKMLQDERTRSCSEYRG